jgi:hypothetical protein
MNYIEWTYDIIKIPVCLYQVHNLFTQNIDNNYIS